MSADLLAAALLCAGLLVLVLLVGRTVARVSKGDGILHSEWPEDLTEIIRDDYGRHSGQPPLWLTIAMAGLRPDRPRRHRLLRQEVGS